MENPVISVCVSVYNSEPYLPMFLDSILNQSFDEYEVVLADNCSTDNSLDILRKYEAAFPEKVFVYQTDGHGYVGKGRNLAFQKSCGKYIYFCDSDDLVHPSALDKLYNEAIRQDADMVCGRSIRIIEEDGEIVKLIPYGTAHSGKVSNDTEINSPVQFWLRLIKRELIEKVGPVPEDAIFDDVKYVTILKSYAKNICHIDFPIYYFFYRGKDTSPSSTLTKALCIESGLDSHYVLEHGNPKYTESLQYYVASRAADGLYGRWPFFDLFVKEIQEYAEWFYENKLIKSNSVLFGKLRWADSCTDYICPNIVYVDGFSATLAEKRMEELREKVFHDGCQIVTLSPESCDVNENEYVKLAYNRGDMALVTSYFALKSIYENGGVFIHDNIRILNYFSYLKYQNAFFSLIDKKTYSEWIYGAPAGNEAIGAILKTYSAAWDKKGEYMPLSERISIILTAKYGIPLDGKERLFQEVVSVLSPGLSVVDTRFGDATKKCAFEHDFSACAGEAAYATLPRSTLRLLMAPAAAGPSGKSAREKALERELEELKQSNTYKLMMKIRAIGDGPHGPRLKKIFHGMLRVRKKLKGNREA